MDIAGRFTQNAREALGNAQKEARTMGHNYIGTEHVLLGILSVEESAARQLLIDREVSAETVRQHILRLVGKGDFNFNEAFGLTPRTKNVIELSIREARSLNNDYVGTEHFLLALVREQGSIASRILIDMHIDLKKLREELLAKLKNKASKKDKNKSTTPKLDQFSRDLTEAAKSGELDPVIGRQKEIERVIQILSRRTKNNPVLIGETGVGKTAVAEGLAQRIADGNIPELLKGKRVMALDLSGMLAGAKFRGEFEERLKVAMDEIKKNNKVILFIDELHTIIGAGAAEGAMDAANILKPALARGEIQAVGATTLKEYRKHVEKDAALERRFQPVMVGEPNSEEALLILKGLRDKYEAHHKVQITDDALEAAVTLSDRYISDRYLPDKAIDLMDEAASRMRIMAYNAPPDMKELERRLDELKKAKLEAVNNQIFEKAAKLRDEEKRTAEEMQRIKESWEEQTERKSIIVTQEEIAEIVSSWVGIPAQQLTQDESERLLHMEEKLHERVIGQDEAVQAISRAIRRARAGLQDPRRPIGSFVFLGPTGVGKTELCKALAEVMFGDENAMIRVDMSEYMERHAVSKLLGSPPGYVGYDEAGQLTEKVRRKPYSVVLLDEIEKAHPDVFNILLQILEDGRLTDSQGRTVDFRNTIIIMTSNVGAVRFGTQKRVGFGSTGREGMAEYERMKDDMMEELKKTFRPEFINRIDEIIVFHNLNESHSRQIVELMVFQVAERMKEKEIEMTVTDNALDYLAKEGFDPVYGARPLRRLIQRLLEDKLAEEILAGHVQFGSSVVADVVESELVIKTL